MKRFCNRVRHRVVMTWARFQLWWFLRQWTKKSRRVKQIMNQREDRFGELRADNARLRDQLDHALDALRASHGGCRMPSVGDECDCGLCKRDRQITDLQAIIGNLPRQPNGEYLQCPLCRQYLDTDGTCPEGCGNIGKWLSIYERAQKAVEDNERLREIVGQLEQTADAVPVIPHKTKVYHPEEIGRDGPAHMYITGSNFAWVTRGARMGTPYYETSTCYSTPELALASLKQAQLENTEGD